jgi:hypothetical protein
MARPRPRAPLKAVAAGLVAAAVAIPGAHAAAGGARPACFGAAARDPRHPCQNPKLRLSVVPSVADAPIIPNAPCTVEERVGPMVVCAFGVRPENANATVALVGDSHSMNWRAALQVAAEAKHWRAVGISRGGCPFTEAVRNLPQPRSSGCQDWTREVVRWFGRHPEVSTTFVVDATGGSGVRARSGQDEFSAAVDGYLRAWRALPPSVKHIVVIRDMPHVGFETFACIRRAQARRQPPGPACAVSRQAALAPDAQAMAAPLLRSPHAQVVDLTRFVCDPALCYPVVGGVLVFKDTTHMTRTFATTLGPYLLHKVRALEARW